MSLQLTFLGTGTSAGVPMIGCACPVCASADPRDRRSRASVLLRFPDPSLRVAEEHAAFNPAQFGHRQLLIDLTPELRQQVMTQRLSRLDGVLITHAHADHIFGLDDLRRFNAVMHTSLDLFAEPLVIERLRETFRYIFDPQRKLSPSFVPNLIARPVEAAQPRDFFGATVTPLRLMHGRLPILGYRCDHGGASVAYCTDVSSIPPQTWPLLRDLDVLVLDALRYRHHPTHLTVERALQIIEELAPKQAYLTHIAHDISHADLSARLPPGVALAHDNLVVDLPPAPGPRKLTL